MRVCFALLLTFLFVPFVHAQNNPCADPKTARFGLFLGLEDDPLASEHIRRILTIERRFREELVKQLPFNSCVVEDMAIFSDPANYPALKGSTFFEIDALPSLKNTSVAAVAIGISLNEGAYFGQSIPLQTVSVLIEKDSDYAFAAKCVIESWMSLTNSLAGFFQKH